MRRSGMQFVILCATTWVISDARLSRAAPSIDRAQHAMSTATTGLRVAEAVGAIALGHGFFSVVGMGASALKSLGFCTGMFKGNNVQGPNKASKASSKSKKKSHK